MMYFSPCIYDALLTRKRLHLCFSNGLRDNRIHQFEKKTLQKAKVNSQGAWRHTTTSMYQLQTKNNHWKFTLRC